ncbi:ribosome binding protein [Babesia ovata]|uniref:Ribosome binding protein n=1 Tax=Babesia ovata TaxID=189622 RepID=A0A2H6KHY9_9APIC|nr:ribosome binding protein [Babesia ovata]GBE62608.1 ribosome binding protein [Babesia ovata]
MEKHGVELNTLKDCLQFLMWLHDGEGKKMQSRVINELVTRYGISNNHISFTGQLPRAVSEFLEHVSTFYKKLVATPIKESYIDPKAKDVTEALLDCIPKFLAALYFLLYNVDRWFEAVGGGKWRYNYPGWESTWVRYLWHKEWGGWLQNYLRATLSVNYGGLILGGFGPGEVTYGYEYGSRYAYRYGESMVDDLRKILDKHNDKYNDFRDVFVTSVISKAGTHKVNTANVLALVKTFCEIVISVKSPDGVLKTAVQKKNTCLDWEELKQHCKTLEQQLGKLFNIEGFSFTGQARTVYQLNTERFAGETAEWFRNNLHEVQHNVKQIDTKFPVDNTRHLYYLQPFATENIFPYGFIFGKDRYGTLGDAWKTLSDHWDSVIDMLGKDRDGLDKLKRILDGEPCRPSAPPPKPRPRPAPAPRPPRPARPATPPRPPGTPGVRTTGTRGGGGSLSSGNYGSGARRVGGHNRRSMIQVRGRGQNRGAGPGAQRGRGQGPGPRGAPGANGARASRSPGSSVSIKPQPLQSQDDLQSHPQQPLPAASSAHRDPSPPAATLLTPDRLVSQASVHDHSSASSSSSSSSSVTVTGGQERSPQAAASGHIQQSSQDSSPNQDSNPHIPGQHSAPGGGGANGAIGVPSAGGSLAVDSKDSITTSSKPVAPPSNDLSQAQSALGDVQSARHNSDPGSPRPSLTQDRSSRDGAPGPMGALAHPIPDPDSKASPAIHPSVSSSSMHTQNSNIQSPDSLSSRGRPPDGAQDLKDQALSSNPTQQNSSQSSDVRSTLQGSPGPDTQSSAVGSAGPGGDEANGGGGVSADGTDGDPQVGSHSGQSLKASQLSVQHQTPGHSAPGSPSSGIPGLPGSVTTAPQPVDPPAPTLTQAPSVPGPGSGSPGVHGTGQQGGHVVSQQGNQVVSQPTSQGVDQTPSSVGPTSAGPASGGGGGPASAKPSVPATPLQPTKPPPPPPPCSSGMAHAKFGGRKLCFPNPKVRKPTSTFALSEQDLNTVWTRVQEEKSYNTDHTQKDTQGPQTRQASSISNQHLHPSIHSSQPPSHHPGVSLPAAPGPRGSQPDNYRDIDNSGPVNPAAVRLARWLQDSTLVSGHPVVDKTDDPNEEYVRVQRKKNAEQKLADVQKKIYEQQNRRNLFTGKAISNAKGIADSAVPQGSAGIGVPMGYPIKPPKLPTPQLKSTPQVTAMLEVTGGPVSDPHHDQEEFRKSRLTNANLELKNKYTRKAQMLTDERYRHAKVLQQKDKEAAEAGRQQKLLEEMTEELIVPKPKSDGYNHDFIVSNALGANYTVPPIIDKDPLKKFTQGGYDNSPPTAIPPEEYSKVRMALEAENKHTVYGDVHISVQKPSFTESHDDSDQFDLHIDVRKPIVQDPVDNTYDDPYANDDDVLRDEFKNAESWHGEDKGFSVLPKSNFNLEFTPSFLQSDGDHDPGIPRDTPRKPYDQIIPVFPDSGVCQNPWYVPDASSTTVTPPLSPPPDTDQLPPPKTVRDMLHWMVGLNQYGYVAIIKKHIEDLLKEYNKDASQPPDALEVTRDPYNLDASIVSNTLTEACHYAASVLHRLKHKDISTADTMPDFSSEYSKLRYTSNPACLLCQLRDYAYACCHQLTFLKSQCSREQSQGGWQNCEYGHDVPSNSPLQDFLTDASDSKFETHPFDPCDICLKSRVNMGFTKEDLPASQQTGKHILTILTPSCGGEDPLLTLCSYLNCITRRTPRTAGEIVSFFHNFGNSLHDVSSQLSQLGSALSTRHDDCPGWDSLKDADLQAVQGIRGSATPTANHNHDHLKTLSTLLGCGINSVNCPPRLSPITYRAYALYSSSFAHRYLSWTVYLADRLYESLVKLHCDLKDLQCHDSKSKPLHQCANALPLLYSHGFTPPEGMPSSQLKCSDVITKLEEVLSGKPIADLMTAMDNFLYNIRMPFLYTVFTLWLTATLYIAHSLLYRMDVLRIRSHLLTTRASHLIDVKALLAGSRRMLSLYKDVDYFDDDFHSVFVLSTVVTKMTKHGVPLGTLKECLHFLEWLHSGQGSSMRVEVSRQLFSRIYTYYNNPGFERLLGSSLDDFLRHASELYKQISTSAKVGDYKDKKPDDVVKAFSECLSKVHSAFSLLLFHVDYSYTHVGGGKWKDMETQNDDFAGIALKGYLTATNTLTTGGIIPGGFSSDELQNVQGITLAENLNAALQRNISTPDLFTSVLFDNLVKNDWHNLDAGNVLLLLWAFCDYVKTHEGGGDLKDKLETELKSQNRCIEWKTLVEHCRKLKGELSKLFGSDENQGAFSTTGRAFTTTALKPEAFAGAFEKWFTNHWKEMTGALEDIKGSVEDFAENHAEFTPESLYPYGIVLNKDQRDKWPEGLKNLHGVLDVLGDSNNGELKDLKEILEGTQCPPEPPQEVVPEKKVPVVPPKKPVPEETPPYVATKTEATKPVVTKAEAAKPTTAGNEGSPNQNNGQAEGAQNQGKKSEGAQNQGKKSEGAQNQGKKAEGTPNQSKGQIDISSSGSQDIKSLAPGPSPGGPGGTGQPGSKGNKGDAGPPGSTGPVTPASSQVPAPPVQNADQTQQPSQPPPAPPPPPPPPPLPGGGVIPPNSVPPDQDSPDSVSSGQKPTATPVTVSPQTPGVSHAQPVPTGDKGAGPPGGGGDKQGGGQGAKQNVNSITTAPAAPAPGGGPSSGGKPVQTDENCPRSKGYKQIELWPGRGNYCVKDFDYKQQEAVHKQFDEQIKKAQSDIQERKRQREEKLRQQREVEERKREAKEERRKEDERRRQEEVEESKRKLLQGMEMRTKILNKHPGRPMYPGADRVEDEFREIHLKSHPGTKLTTDHPGTNAVIVEEASASGAKGIPKSTLSHKFPPSDILLGYPIKPPKLPMKYPPVSPHAVPAFADVLEGIDLTKKKRTTERPSVITYNDNAPMTAQMDVVPINYPSNVTGGIIKTEPDKIQSAELPSDVNFDISLSQLTGKEIPNPKKNRHMSPPPASKLPKTSLVGDAKIPSVKIPADHRVIDASMLEFTDNIIPGLNRGPPLPPIPIIKPAEQHGNTLTKALETVTLDDQTMMKFLEVSDTNLTKFTGNDIPVPEPQKMDIPVPPSLAEGSVIPDPNLLKSGSSIPSATLDTPLPPVHIEVNKLTTPEGVLKSDITQAPSLPTVHFIDAALPNNAYQEMDSSDPSVWGNFKNYGFDIFPETGVCRNPWYVADASTTTITPTPSPPPNTDQLPPPNTVREMLHWLVGLNQKGYVDIIKEHLKDLLKDTNKDLSQSPDAIEVTGLLPQLTASHVSNTLTQACLYSATVLHKMKYKNSKDAPTTLNFKSVYCHLRYSTDPACLLCQLRDYAYACYHQLAFLKSQCSRTTKDGGWQDCKYGSDIKMPSPLQAFLTDRWDCGFDTYPFDPCDICLKSRVNMGFTKDDLPETHETGKHISTILSPTCGGDDPLLTLSSHLNCLTRRTPRTTGELVSFFHNFGNSLYKPPSTLSTLGSALSTRHDDCPGWDSLKDADLQAVQGIRGSATPTANHDHGHPNTLSTLLGCGIKSANCPHLLPITHRAYALYSSSFVHDYLSWTVYLPDRLWDSLLKLHCDFEKLQCHDSRAKPLHQCAEALPLLYRHGITPPDGALQPSLTCAQVIAKLREVVAGEPIASLMTAMDTFLYRIRAPFLYTVFTLWLIAALYILHSLLYRMDVLRIRSHLLTTRASHLIDVKALLAAARVKALANVKYFSP